MSDINQNDWASQEFYLPRVQSNNKLAQELYDKGLIWAINHSTLHVRGYALGVKIDDNDKVTELMIVKIDPSDPDGEIIFAPETGLEGYTKFLDSEHDRIGTGLRLKEELPIHPDEDVGT